MALALFITGPPLLLTGIELAFGPLLLPGRLLLFCGFEGRVVGELLLIGVKLFMFGPPPICGCGDCCEGFMGPPFIRPPADGPLARGLCIGGPIGGPLFMLGPEFSGELIELPIGDPMGIGDELDIGRPGPGPI